MKRCVLYLRGDYDDSLLYELKKNIEVYTNMEPVMVKMEEELALYGNSDTIQSTGMVIYDGGSKTIPTVLFRDYQNCYHIWFDPDAKSREGKNRYLHGFKTLEDVEIFLGNPDQYPASFLQYIEVDEDVEMEEMSQDTQAGHYSETNSLTASVENIKEEEITAGPSEESETHSSGITSIVELELNETTYQAKQMNIKGPAITELLEREKENSEDSEGKEPAVPTQIIDYNENPLFTRSTKIQKQAFSRPIKEHHKTIGLWSPIHRMGVTTLTINFSIYLAQNRVNIAVLEGLTEKHMLKDWLKRYTEIPANWNSYARSLQMDTDPKKIQWFYKDAYFLPLDSEDKNFKWTPPAIETFMDSIKIFDVAIVDYPTGKAASYTEQSMTGLTELWIVVDDDFQQILSWSEYISTLQKKLDIPFYLIFNKKMDFSQPKKLADKLGIELLVEIPSLHEVTMRNYYETKPIWETVEGRQGLEEPFSKLFKHVTGKKPEQFNDIPKEKKVNRIMGFIRSLKD